MKGMDIAYFAYLQTNTFMYLVIHMYLSRRHLKHIVTVIHVLPIACELKMSLAYRYNPTQHMAKQDVRSDIHVW